MKYHDFGLGYKDPSKTSRVLNNDGSFNIKKTHVSWWDRTDLYHSFISMSWLRFLIVIMLGYLGINLIFASIYFTIGLESLSAVQHENSVSAFKEAFFFSTQTFTTLGYGRVAPVGEWANWVASMESMVGLLSVALGTGLMYGRFSKPNSKIRYSNYGLVSPYKDGLNAFMFRVVNPTPSQLLEVGVEVSVSLKNLESGMREFHNLKLERSQVKFFPSMWTIVHPLDDESILKDFDEDSIKQSDIEIIIFIKAYDESFAQSIYSRRSYKSHEIEWGKKFVYVSENTSEGIEIDVSRINETQTISLNRNP